MAVLHSHFEAQILSPKPLPSYKTISASLQALGGIHLSRKGNINASHLTKDGEMEGKGAGSGGNETPRCAERGE
jgi:hypothetical protein